MFNCVYLLNQLMDFQTLKEFSTQNFKPNSMEMAKFDPVAVFLIFCMFNDLESSQFFLSTDRYQQTCTRKMCH